MSRRQSGVFSKSTPESNDDPSLKRKASDDDMDDEPTHKTVHTGMCLMFPLAALVPTVHP